MPPALRGFWAGTSPSILAIGLDFRIARQAAVFPLVLDHLKLDLLNLFNTASQRFTEERPTPIDLAQASVAAALGDGG